MAINPEELLIFKMRGVKPSEAKPGAEAKQAAAATPEPAPQPPQAPQAPVEAPQQEEMAEQVQAPQPEAMEERPKPQPKAQAKPLFSFFKPKPRQPEKEIQPIAVRSEIRATTKLEVLTEEEKKMRELEKLEQEAALFEEAPEGMEMKYRQLNEERPAVVVSAFSTMTGILFLVTAFLFEYSIYPQTEFVIGYIQTNGIAAFFQAWTYDYVTAFVNTVLAASSAFSGLLLLSSVRRSHLFCGATAALMLIVVSYEYLNSGAPYLLIVSVLAFMCIVSLAYSRMSAVSSIEHEAPSDVEINWPRIETF